MASQQAFNSKQPLHRSASGGPADHKIHVADEKQEALEESHKFCQNDTFNEISFVQILSLSFPFALLRKMGRLRSF